MLTGVLSSAHSMPPTSAAHTPRPAARRMTSGLPPARCARSTVTPRITTAEITWLTRTKPILRQLSMRRLSSTTWQQAYKSNAVVMRSPWPA